MKIRDRIKELRRVPAKTLIPNPKNWRTHPDNQRDALKGILAEVGYADALIARELPDGSLQLIDGHLRAETTPEQNVPVLILDITDEEADKLLATLDPLSALAGTNRDLLEELLENIETDNLSLQQMLNHLAGTPAFPGTPAHPDTSLTDLKIPELYQILIECEDENEQRDIYEKLETAGIKCRIVNL